MRQLYMWDEWFGGPLDEDGKARVTLVRGQHYSCSQASMCQQIRTAAKDRGLLVNVQDMNDRIIVVVRLATRQLAPCSHPGYVSGNEAKAMAAEDRELRSRERNA
jgi:hypothetical protein